MKRNKSLNYTINGHLVAVLLAVRVQGHISSEGMGGRDEARAGGCKGRAKQHGARKEAR